MAETFRLTLAQLNPTVGDLSGNAEKAMQAWEAGKAAGADMVATPEMFISGYQTQDLVMKPAFALDCMAWVEKLANRLAEGPVLGIGGPYLEDGALYNAYWVLRGGRIVARMLKNKLPNEQGFRRSAPV